jgi:hypothetical protein
MHCQTKEEAQNFVDYLKTTSWNHTWSLECYYGKNVCFFNKGTWCDKEYAIREGYTILEWSDFMNKEFTKADLKTGDVIKRRNGWVEIVNRDLDMFITKDGWNDMKDTREDLTDKQGDEYDIVAVRRPITKGHCQFNAFQYEWGTLVYERKEPEEMTLEEVCRLLGKEIKIVK